MGDSDHISWYPMSVDALSMSSKPEKDDVSSANRKETASSLSGFTLEYPKRAAKAILENREYLENLFPKWGWQFQVFAGYDILPEGYKSVAGRNSLESGRFQGEREMLWVEMHETQLFRSPDFTKFVTDTISNIIRMIAQYVFSPVGFLDVRDFWALECDLNAPNGLEVAVYTYFLYKDALIPKYRPVTTLNAQFSDNVPLYGRPSIPPHPLTPTTGYPGMGQPSYNYGGCATPGLTLRELTTPIRGFVDILYRDLSHQISLSKRLRVSSSTRLPQMPNGRVNSDTRTDCYISLAEVDARITRTTQNTLPQRDDPLRIEEIRIEILPTIYENTEQGKSYRLFDAYTQQPSLLGATVSGISTSRAWGASLGLSYPGASVGVSAQHRNTITRPATAICLDVRNVEIGIVNQNSFAWIYPISAAPAGCHLLNKSVQFANHSGHIAYPTTKAPDAITVKTTVTCSLLHQTRSFNRWCNPLRGLLPCVTFIRDNNVEYPCRHVRFNLRTDVSPDDDGRFEYPRNDEHPARVDLGKYGFTDDHGKFCLEIQRLEEPTISIQEPHRHTGQLPITTGRLGVTADRPGEFKFTEHSVKRESHKVVATLELGVEEPPRKKQMRRKPN